MSLDNQYRHIDLEAINDIADGDSEFVREIVGNSLTTVSVSIQSLADAVAEGNPEQIVFFAHKLKGSFAFVGAERLQHLASDIESNPKDSDTVKSKLSEMLGAALEAEAELRMVMAELADQRSVS